MRRVAVALAIVSAAVGCTSLLGLESARFEGDDDASSSDGSMTDSSGDGSTADAPSASDGGGDGGDAGSRPFCEGRDATLCEDFEGPLDSRLGTSTPSRATLVVVDAGGLSPPNAVVITTNTLSGGESATALYGANFFGDLSTRATLDFGLLIETKDDSARMPLASVQIFAGDPCSFQLERGTTADVVKKYGGPDYPLTGRLPVGAWTRVRFTLERATSDWRILVAVDGTTFLDASTTCPFGLDAGGPSFQFGDVTSLGPSGPWKLSFDDVAIEIAP